MGYKWGMAWVGLSMWLEIMTCHACVWAAIQDQGSKVGILSRMKEIGKPRRGDRGLVKEH